jgi:hypothetical protein
MRAGGMRISLGEIEDRPIGTPVDVGGFFGADVELRPGRLSKHLLFGNVDESAWRCRPFSAAATLMGSI